MRAIDWLIAVIVFGAMVACVVTAIACIAWGEPAPVHLS